MSYPSKSYIHDLDRSAFSSIQTFPAIEKIVGLYVTNVTEKMERMEYLSSSIRLNDQQMPEIYRLLPPICEKLGIDTPELYYIQSKEPNAWTFGSKYPYICVTSELVKKLPPESVSSVLAHECGHIACGHGLYHTIARILAQGIDSAVDFFLPKARRFITPTIIRALLFWDRCSELSADRASVLYDGSSERTVRALLQVHGYDDQINVREFIKQAADLHAFVDDNKINRVLEEIMIQGDTHPSLAARAYECDQWANSVQYKEIRNGTYESLKISDANDEIEIVEADVQIRENRTQSTDELDRKLDHVNDELSKVVSSADKTDYAIAVASGLITGVLDAFLVGETTISDKDIGLSHKQVNQFIERYAKSRNLEGNNLKGTISNLEDAFPVLQDNVWSGASIGVSAKNHHLADLAHHPTPLGLAAAIAVRFLRVGTFVNKDGELHFILVKTTAKDIVEILAPAVISGFLNWLVYAGENIYKEETGNDLPEYIKKLARIAAAAPIIIEVAKCADNWFGHLVSDMGGSKQTAGAGMGIPGIFVSLLYEVAALPGLKDTGLPRFLNDLYEKQKLNLRHELPLYKNLGKQAIPVVLNEILVRSAFFVRHFAAEVSVCQNLRDINWSNVIPFGNRTVDRMMTVASITFTLADTVDASVRAAVESGGNWVLFAGKFVSRFNYVGAGRAAVSIVKEISYQSKEAQLIHEKLLLTEQKTDIILKQLQEYKSVLEERVTTYLAEDIEAFLNGFNLMNEGMASGDSDLIIRGNVVIQKVLGRKPQFTTQEEFDDLMESDEPLQL